MRSTLLLTLVTLVTLSTSAPAQVLDSDYFRVIRTVIGDLRSIMPNGPMAIDPRIAEKGRDFRTPTVPHPEAMPTLVQNLGFITARVEDRKTCTAPRECKLAGVESIVTFAEPVIRDDTAGVWISYQANKEEPYRLGSIDIGIIQYTLVRRALGWAVIERKFIGQS
jgi:hypothetical protein